MNYYWLIGAAVFLAGAFFIRNLNIFVCAVYLKKPDNHLFSVSFSLFKRLKVYTFQCSPPDFFPGGTADFKNGDAPAEKECAPPCGEDSFSLYLLLFGKLAASLYFEKIRLKLTYGFEDAALTGVSNGVLAALRGVFLAVCGAYCKMREAPDISISPVYGRDRLEIEFNCIFTVRLGNVIAIAATALISFCTNLIKHYKDNFIQGGEARWRNILFKT